MKQLFEIGSQVRPQPFDISIDKMLRMPHITTNNRGVLNRIEKRQGLKNVLIDEAPNLFNEDDYMQMNECLSFLDHFVFYTTEFLRGKMLVHQLSSLKTLNNLMENRKEIPKKYRVKFVTKDGKLFIEKESFMGFREWLFEINENSSGVEMCFVFHD